ncbi:transcriptional regulator [Xaviernesmea oryzae]|uniref:Transcriptional regulator n=1 Tax=Xaviernesmea oryzae TaxID=464029 RepID=A0A1Q9B0S8_9HYPH|nr:transcriptional regulator [Xaviernesmea oryzae]OLP61574.1 transcriptional regulator [Xaviernesmea oryzae]SEL07845.1 phosphomannomutase [Xaviernesmea oryzae]
MTKALIRIVRDDAEALEDAAARFREAWAGRGDSQVVLTFSSPTQLFEVLSPKRWQLIETLQATGPQSLRALARALGRDVKRVHQDVHQLIDWSLIAHDEAGRVFVPFEVIHADFDLRAVA